MIRAKAVRPGLAAAALAAALIVAVAGTSPSPAARPVPRQASPLTRYSIVHHCYELRSPSGQTIGNGVGPFRMQAAALGIYLLYGPQGQYLTDQGGGKLAGVSTPSTATEWRVDGSEQQGFTITNLVTNTQLPVTFVPANGCATFPEAEVNAHGTPAPGPSAQATVHGTIEGHAHITAFEGFGGDLHCGRPWSPFGAPTALPYDCSPYQQGSNGAFEEAIDYAGPRPANFHGWPIFDAWPTPTTLAEEGDYYTGIERAWKAGLRVLTTQDVDNEALCTVMTTKHNPCNDMEGMRIQHRDLYALQDYIDAQSGGPGKGWFRIVTDPFHARQVINQGKLAVVEGLEVSRVLGCGEHMGVPECDRSQVDAGLRELRALNIHTFFPVHEFDNGFGGSKMIGGEAGVIINAGNRFETGTFFAVQSCPADQQDAEQVAPPAGSVFLDLLNGGFAPLLGGNPLPLYPPPPHCNTRGLTDLGAYLIDQMAKQHFLIQVDHMSSRTEDAALAIAERMRYPGVWAAHCCGSDQLFARIYALGGFVNPNTRPAVAHAARWQFDKARSSHKYVFGFGYGSDLNGLGAQPGPDSAHPIPYPFKSYDGAVTFDRERWGERTFDLNTDGLANYGMYADWLQLLRQVASREMMVDMFNGAEAFLQTWERAEGVHATSCRPAGERFSSIGLGSIHLGIGTIDALFRTVQPSSRPGRSYRYCVAGRSGGVASVFDQGGKIVVITSTASGDLAGGIGPGATARQVRSRARRLFSNVWVGSSRLGGGARYLYGVNGGRVVYAALATANELRSISTLRADLKAAGV
jgi:hypothetical protein